VSWIKVWKLLPLKIFDERLVDDGADCNWLRIHQWRARFHRDPFGRGANCHLKVDGERILDMKNDIRLDQFDEARLFKFDAIGTWRQICQIILARTIGCSFVSDICADANGGHSRIDNHRFGGIGDATADRGICRLGRENRREGKADHEDGE
jgi:hypothetical protein